MSYLRPRWANLPTGNGSNRTRLEVYSPARPIARRLDPRSETVSGLGNHFGTMRRLLGTLANLQGRKPARLLFANRFRMVDPSSSQFRFSPAQQARLERWKVLPTLRFGSLVGRIANPPSWVQLPPEPLARLRVATSKAGVKAPNRYGGLRVRHTGAIVWIYIHRLI